MIRISLALYALFILGPCFQPALADSAPAAATDAPSAAVRKTPDFEKPIRDKWALVVGIGTFEDKNVPHLKYATKDARDFYNFLINEANFAPDHVRLLLDDKATQRHIMSELGNRFLARMAKPDDMIVIFFSTHGSPSQMDIRGKNYIVAYDSDPSDLFSSGIEMQKILDAIQGRVLSDRVLLIMDACHSGSVDPNAKGMFRVGNFDALTLAEGSGQVVICSSGTDEQSWESKRYQNGVFTKNLLDGLRKAKNAPISQGFDSALASIQDEVRQDYPGMRQTPVLRSKWQGNDLIIGIKPTAPEPIPQTVRDSLEPDSTAVTSSSAAPVQPNVAASDSGKQTLLSKSEPTLEDLQGGSLVVTANYFSHVDNPRKAYMEACSEQDAHFNQPEAYYLKAKLLIQLGSFSKAEQELKGLLVDEPNDWRFHLARAYCYHKMKQETAAKNELQQAIDHNPTLPRNITWGD